MSALIRPDKLMRTIVLKTQVNHIEQDAFNAIADRLGQTGAGFLRQLVCQAIHEDEMKQQERLLRGSQRVA